MNFFFKTLSALLIISTSLHANSTCCPNAGNSKYESVSNANIMLIPESKGFFTNYVENLFARGKKEVYSGKALDTIGMPCGGIGCGQMYVTGDGRLADWQISAFGYSRWVSNTGSTFAYRRMRKRDKQGFAIVIKSEKSKSVIKQLAAKNSSQPVSNGFENVAFNGTYPIATISYSEPGCPVKISSEVFSPFIPLEATNSSFPATIFNITVENISKTNVKIAVLNWLENLVSMNNREKYKLTGKTTFETFKDSELMIFSADQIKKTKPADYVSIVFANFENTDWNNWTAEGKAFGSKPVRSRYLKGQSTIYGYNGKGYINTKCGGNISTGNLTSPEFTINENYINFLIGGGCSNGVYLTLVIDGKEVEKSEGNNAEELVWKNWNVKKYRGKKAKIKIVDAATSSWGHINIDNIEFSNYPQSGSNESFADEVDYGDITFACLNDASKESVYYPDNQKEKYIISSSVYPLTNNPHFSNGTDGSFCGLQSTKFVNLKPGEKKTFSFILTWYFPVKEHGWLYAKRFSSSADVAKYIINNFDCLTKNTHLWRDIYYNSSLPYWLLDRLHSTVSYLATGTAYWWENGRFYAFEGCHCCRGTCTHVWGYAQSHARLFPSIARNIREEQDFKPAADGGGFFPETGLVAFRGGEDRCWFAADGQCDTVLNAYRESLMSPDKRFLKRNYKSIKKALQYLINQDALGEKGGINSGRGKLGTSLPKPTRKPTNPPDGIIEGTQHNTYDLNYHGPNTLVGSLYLAALRAGEKMALEMDDKKFAALCSNLYESGSAWTVSNLWNGEYFVQKVDLKKYPEHQYKDGCLSDQLFGQFWAHQIGLGYIYPTNYVKSAMETVWKYNFAPDVGPYNQKFKPGRWFIKKEGNGGLFTCTWPRGDYLPKGTLYKNEIWTGIEYQFAAGLIEEGMVTQGLAVCKAIHDRYQPGFLNPYNEIECGDHYARAMASWGVYLALAGFQYDGPNGFVGFNPIITPENFKAAFTLAESWVVFEQTRDARNQINKLTIKKGTLEIQKLSFGIPKQLKSKNVIIRVNGKIEKGNIKLIAEKVFITFDKKVKLNENDELKIKIKK